MRKATLNIQVKAKPTNLSEFPVLRTDYDNAGGYTTEYTAYGHPRFPSINKCIIVKVVTEDASGNMDSMQYMEGSTGSQWDFSCKWANRLTGDYAEANLQK